MGNFIEPGIGSRIFEKYSLFAPLPVQKIMSDLHSHTPVPVAVCETQPLTADGVATTLAATGEFRVVLQASSLDELRVRALHTRPQIALVDKNAGPGDLRDWLEDSSGRDDLNVSTIVWATAVAEAETVKLMHAGVRGVLRKAVSRETLLACFRAVASGQRWMEEDILRPRYLIERSQSELTPREQQVMSLVQTGLRNREIAVQLGIRPGTVKIHLKHIFEKTGIRGRYGLALDGLQKQPQTYGAVNGNSEHHELVLAD